MAMAPQFTIQDVRFSERNVALRLPFRFGVATVTSCPQVHVRVRIAFADGTGATGCSAEMMIPKWFDKNLSLSHEDNFEQLRRALRNARAAYTSGGTAKSAFGHFAAHYADVLAAGAVEGLNPLLASYGPALLDRAILDAVCLHRGCSFSEAMGANLPGMATGAAANGLAGDLDGFDLAAFLSAQSSRTRGRTHIAARHTVGLLDAIAPADAPADAPHDGLPVTLQGAIRRYGHRHFKLKLCGDTPADIARLGAIARVIGEDADVVTLDGNEQYPDARAFAEFLDAFTATPALAKLARTTPFVEQPIRRDQALAHDMHALAARVPLLVDESDATLDSFVQARALGYAGVSSKSCKGFYKSVINAARCAAWNAEGGRAYFLSGEDLTMQAGVGVQQDLALVSWLGLTHVERNGHHYVNGMAALPEAEQRNFLHDHGALYEHAHGATRLRIERGRIDVSSLGCGGFATVREGAGIDWQAMAVND